MEIKNQGDFNLFADEIEKKISDVEKEAVKAGDIELMKKDNEDLKVTQDNLIKQLEEIKEAQMSRFVSKSEDEKKHDLAIFMLATGQKDYETIVKMGGKIVKTSDQGEWTDIGWQSKAAPDVGTPKRGDVVTGSIMIPNELSAEMLRIPGDPSGLMDKVRTVPMNVRKITFPKTLTGVDSTWVTNEITAKTETNPTETSVDLECETYAAWTGITQEFTEDLIIDYTQYLAQLFREDWANEYDKQLLTASAAPFTGITVNTSAEYNTMASTSFNAIKASDILNTIGKLTTQSKRNGASFIMHVTIYDLLKSLVTDAGTPIFATMQGIQPQTLYGYPVIFSDAMPDKAASAADTGFVAFGNPKNLMHGDRIGMQFRIFGETMDTLIYDRTYLQVRMRQGFVAANPEGFAILKTKA